MVLAIGLPISFDRPEWLWLLLAIPVIVTVSLRTLSGLDLSRRIVAVALRSAVIATLALALAGIEYVKTNNHVAVMFVMDKSRSIPDHLRLQAQEYIRKIAKKMDRDDRLGVISFDGQADVDAIPSRGPFDIPGFSMADEPDRTNVASGLRMALAAFPEGFARRVVIITDGNENIGNLTEEIETAIASEVAVDILPLQYQHKNEILFDRIVVRSQASLDTKIPVRMIIKSRRKTQAKLTLYHNDVEVPLADPVIQLSGNMRSEPFTVPIELQTGGVHRFDARITPFDENADSIPQNNRATAFTFVDEKGKVLILTDIGSDDEQVLLESLNREKIEVEKRSVDQVPIDLLKLQEYSVVILSNISADNFNDDQHKILRSYVRDFGGGLIMTGGEEGFGAGGWIGTPLEEVSPVFFEVKHKKVIPRGALAIVMHSCEIPRGNYWGEQVAIAAVKTISSQDYLGVICYSPRYGGPHWDVPLAPASDKRQVIQAIKQMQIGDMPDFDKTMLIAIKDLMALKDAAQRHMIIISDGDPQPPSQATIKKMVDNKITCSTVGIGYGVHVKEPPMRMIANKTGGTFYSVKNPKRLPQIFVKEAKIVKRPLIDEREFKPALVFPTQTTLGIANQELPPLGGLVLTTPKPDCSMPIARKTSDGNDPVLAHWNYEMGKMAVFTSGLWKKWGNQWAAWPKFGKFWAQLIRWTMRQPGSADFDVLTRLEGKKGRVVIEALNKDASYLNFLRISGKLVTPSAETKPLYLNQTGPGRYETTFDVDDDGNYLINMKYNDPEEGTGMICTGLSVPYSQEFRELQANMPLLNQTVERTPTSRMLTMNPDSDDVFSKNLPPSISRQPVWRWVVQWLLLPLFLLDVASRRLASVVAMSVYVELAVFALVCAILHTTQTAPWIYIILAIIIAEAVGWTIRLRSIVPAIKFFTATVTALSRAGQRSAQALSQLKGVSKKVRQDLDTGRITEADATTIELEPQTDTKARFDVGDEKAAKPAAQLTETLGESAATQTDDQKVTKTGSQPPGKGRGSLTDRLRKAKQRAQDEIREQEEKD
ncbi:MAG: VWA domain-containing protein [Planctomycetota bacterium]|jgi:uncharacterized membrane protein